MKRLTILIISFIVLMSSVFAEDYPIVQVIKKGDTVSTLKWFDKQTVKKIIVVRQHSTKAVKPENGKNYITADSLNAPNTSSFTGKGNLVVYIGKDVESLFEVKNLTPETDYNVDFYYLDASGNLSTEIKHQSREFITLAPLPKSQAKMVLFKPSAFTLDIAWKRGDGKSCLVLMKKGRGNLTPPVNGKEYKADNSFGKGNSTDNDSTFVVYNGTGTSVKVKGLESNTKYEIKVFEYNGKDKRINYNYSDAFLNPSFKSTLLETPVLSDLNIISSTSFHTLWKGVKGADVYEFDLATDKEFKNILTDFQALDVGNITDYTFEDVPAGEYYIRIRAMGDKNRSENSEPRKVVLK